MEEAMAMIFDEMGDQEAFTALVLQDLEAEFGARELFQPGSSPCVADPDECDEPHRSPATARECSMTLEEIGKRLGVGRERVRQIEAKAMRKIRALDRAQLLGEAREPPYVHFVDEDAKLVHSREVDGSPWWRPSWRKVALLIWKYCGMYQWQYADDLGTPLSTSPLIYYTEASALAHGLLKRF